MSGITAKPRVPTTPPNFTIGDIRRLIPARCFERSFIRSSLYLLVDLIAVACLMYASLHIDSVITDDVHLVLPGWILRKLAWVTYWWLCGFVMTGLWVIGHECMYIYIYVY